MKRANDEENNSSDEAKPHAADNSNQGNPPPKRRRTESLANTMGPTTTIVAAKVSIVGSVKGPPKQRMSSQTKSGGGRTRLPEKLLKFLNDEPVPDVVWWMPDGNGFAYNVERVQVEFLDRHFRGTKLTSFVRSLNRW